MCKHLRWETKESKQPFSLLQESDELRELYDSAMRSPVQYATQITATKDELIIMLKVKRL